MSGASGSITRYRLANAEFPLMEPLFTAPFNSGWPYQGCRPGGRTGTNSNALQIRYASRRMQATFPRTVCPSPQVTMGL